VTKRRIAFFAVGGLTGLVFLFALVVFMVTWQSDLGTEFISQPTSTPEPIVPDLIQLAPPEVAQPVMAATGFSLKTGIREAGLVTGERVTYLSLMLVSTGEFDTLTINDHPLDVVYAYLVTKTGVMRLPIPIGFRDGEDYYSLNGGASEFALADRDVALDETLQALPKGQTFGLTALRVSHKDGVDRSDCSQNWSPAWCAFAKEYHQSYGDAERQFVSRIITNKAWLPVGWSFSLYPAEDTVFSQVVPLP